MEDENSPVPESTSNDDGLGENGRDETRGVKAAESESTGSKPPAAMDLSPMDESSDLTKKAQQPEESLPPSVAQTKSQFDDADEADETAPMAVVDPPPTAIQDGSSSSPPSAATTTIRDRFRDAAEVQLPHFPKISASEAAAKAAEFREAQAMKRAMITHIAPKGRQPLPLPSNNVLHTKKKKYGYKREIAEAARSENGPGKPRKKSAEASFRSRTDEAPYATSHNEQDGASFSRQPSLPKSAASPTHNLSPHDILCGPSVGSYPNAGNQFFRRLIRLRQENFRVAKRKPLMREAVVDFVVQVVNGLSPPGRFLGMDVTGSWAELDGVETRNFVAAALAEGVTGIVAWQRPVPAKMDDEDSKRREVNYQARSYTKKSKSSSQPSPGRDSSDRAPKAQEIIDIYDDADVDQVDPSLHSMSPPMHPLHQSQLGGRARSDGSNPMGLEARLLPDRARLPSVGLDNLSSRAALEARLAAGLPRSALLGGGFGPDPSALAYSRLDSVSNLPASLLLGTPPGGGYPPMTAGHPPAGLSMLPGGAPQHMNYGALGRDHLLMAEQRSALRMGAPGRHHLLDGDLSNRSLHSDYSS